MKLDFTQLNELGKEKITHKLVKSQASKTLDYKKEHNDRVRAIYQNIQNGARHKAYILKGLKQDLTAPELLLRACKCISELTDDTLFYKQAKTYIENYPKPPTKNKNATYCSNP